MELADLVGAGAVTRLGALAIFFATGALLAGAGRLLRDERPELRVSVPRGAAPEAVAQAVDDALLVEVGRELGWRDDPIVIDRMVRGLEFIGAMGDRDALLAKADAIDLVRRDPIARARLIERARSYLARVPEPDDATLEAFRQAHAERFRRPPLVTFEHQLVDAGGAPDLVLGPRATRSLPALERAFGADTARAIIDAPAGPDAPWQIIRSSSGEHRVRVLARHDGELPPLAQIRAEVLGAWREAAERDALARALIRLRAATDIDLATSERP